MPSLNQNSGSGPKPRVNYLRRRPRPGGLLRAPGDMALPHELDEKQGMTGGIPSADMQQGKRDLDHGIVDTSKSNEMDQAYQKQK